MILIGLCTKFGALFVAIPEPVIGGVFVVMFGKLTAIEHLCYPMVLWRYINQLTITVRIVAS